jgi:hypothetical protein
VRGNVGKRSSSADRYGHGNDEGLVQRSPGKHSRTAERYNTEAAESGDGTAAHAVADRGIVGNSTALPFLDVIQSSFGRHDVSGVAAHTDPAAQRSSEQLGATAYAKGNHVAFGSTPDLHTAAHEAAHVVQQRAGVHLKGGVGQNGDYYETHANAVADRVVQGESAVDLLDQVAGPQGGGKSDAVQLLSDGDLDMPGASPVDPVTDPSPPPPAPNNDAGSAPAPQGTQQPGTPTTEGGGGGGGDGEWGDPSVEELGRQEVPSEDEPLDAGEPRPDTSMLEGAKVDEVPESELSEIPETLPSEGGGGGGGEVSPELAGFIEQAQNETRDIVGQAEGESNAFKAKGAEMRDTFAEQQQAVVNEKVATMSIEDKRSTLIEMGYSEKQIKKMKPEEIDSIIAGTYTAEIRKARIQGMDVDEAQALPYDQKRQFLADLGIDGGDLDKLGPGKCGPLFDQIVALSKQPGSHKVKAKVKGGPFGRSWEINIQVDGEGQVQEITAEKKGGWFSKLWGWIKAALPIILVVLAPVTGGLSLVALAVWKAAVAIKNGVWLGLITAVAGALSGGVTFMVSKGLTAAASVLTKVAAIATKVGNVARAAQAALTAAKAKSPGSLMAALAGGAAAFASFTENATTGFGATMKKWSEKLETWAKRVQGAEMTVRAAKGGDPLGALQGAFTTTATFMPEGKQEGWERAARVTGMGRSAQQALSKNPPDYMTVADIALQIADEFTASQAIEDASRITSKANTLKQAIASGDFAAIAAAALELANAIAIARYDALHPQGEGGQAGTPTPDQERYKLMTRFDRATKCIYAVGAAVNAAQQKPRPDYITALENVTEVLSLMIGDKWTDRAARLTASFANWTRAVNSRDQMAILNAAEAFGNDIMSVRAEMEQEKADAEKEQAERAGSAAGNPNTPADQKTEELWNLYDMKFESCEWASMEASDQSGTAVPTRDWEQGFDNARQLEVCHQIVAQQPVLAAVETNAILLMRVKQKTQPTQKGPPLTASTPVVKAALDKHKNDVAALFNLLQQGKNEPRTSFGVRWSNACEWLLSGRTKVVALTQTHDAAARAAALGAQGQVAYFGVDVPIPANSDYDFADPKGSRNINISKVGVAGWQGGSTIAIMEPAGKPKETIQDFVVHEVLHASDNHSGSYESRYETEFDAYWLSGRFDNSPAYPGTGRGVSVTVTQPAGAPVATGFDNKRQADIFGFLANSPVYDYVGKEWAANASFRAFVLKHKSPTGENPVNSTRIEAFRSALSWWNIPGAYSAFNALTESDKDAIRSPEARDSWIELLDSRSFFGRDFMRRLGLQVPMAPMIRNFHTVLSTTPFRITDALGAYAMLSDADKTEIKGPLRAQFENLVKSLPSPHDWEFAQKLGFTNVGGSNGSARSGANHGLSSSQASVIKAVSDELASLGLYDPATVASWTGFLPGCNVPAALVECGIRYYRGEYTDAAWALTGLIPFGRLVTQAKPFLATINKHLPAIADIVAKFV